MNVEDHPAYVVVRHDPSCAPLTVIGSLLVCQDRNTLRAYRLDMEYSGCIYHDSVVSPGFNHDLDMRLVTQEEVDQVRALHSLVCR